MGNRGDEGEWWECAGDRCSKEEKEEILWNDYAKKLLIHDRSYPLSSLCMLMRGPRPTTTTWVVTTTRHSPEDSGHGRPSVEGRGGGGSDDVDLGGGASEIT